jgi:hypothetical protein
MGVRVAEWRKPPAKRGWWIWSIRAVACVMLACGMFSLYPTSPAARHCLNLVLLAGAWAMVVDAVTKNRSTSSLAMADVTGQKETFTASVSLRRHGVRTGDDSGVIWFSDGLLHFRGALTEFALPPSLIRSSPIRKGKFVVEYSHAVEVGDQDRSVTVLIAVSRHMAINRAGGTWSFDESLREWATSGDCGPEGAVLPPLTLNRELVPSIRETRAILVALPLLTLVASGVMAVAFRGRPNGVDAVPAVAATATVGVLCTLVFLCQACGRRKLLRLFPDDPVFAGQ